MPLIPPCSIGHLLKLYNVQARKKLGQNFIMNSSITKKIAGFLGPSIKDNYILEIGSGPGMLTRSVLHQGASRFLTIEKDDRFIPLLRELEGSADGRMKLVHGDALQFDPRLLRLSFQQFEATGGEASQANEILAKEENNILDEGCGNKRKLQIIANLPFNISTVLCTRWLKWMSHHHSMPLTEEGDEDRTTIPWDNFMSERPVEMLLIFQKEVAERLVAIPKTKEMSRLTVLAQYVCQTKLVYDLPSKVFVPSPDVDAAVVKFVRKPLSSLPVPVAIINELATLLFNQRRKLARSNLAKYYGSEAAYEMMELLKMTPHTRPEELTVDQFIQLGLYLLQNNIQRKDTVDE